MTEHESDILVVGAGMSGLMVARNLPDDGRTITILDKGRSVGGRLATRRIGPGCADHGAQFFTVRDDRFQALVDRWLSTGLAFRWSHGWSDGSIIQSTQDGYPRFAIRGGMNAMAKALAADLAGRPGIRVQTGVRLTAIRQAGSTGWEAEDSDGDRYRAHVLVLTPPAPQSLALLAAGDVTLHADDRAALERIAYAPCVCGLFHIQGSIDLPEPGAVQRPNEPITWIADNRRKGISPDAAIITVHAGPEPSRRHYDDADDAILPFLQEGLAPYLGPDAEILESQVKRWRYALPVVLHPARYLRAQGLPPLFFGGDAFGGPRVEGAALSGMAIAEVLSS